MWFPSEYRNTVDAHCPLVTAYKMTSLSDPYSSYCCTRQQRDHDPKGLTVNVEVEEMEKRAQCSHCGLWPESQRQCLGTSAQSSLTDRSSSLGQREEKRKAKQATDRDWAETGPLCCIWRATG